MGADGVRILPPIRLLQQFRKWHAVMHISRGHLLFGDLDTMAGVCFSTGFSKA